MPTDGTKVTSDRTQNVTFGEVALANVVHPLSTITPSDIQYEETIRSFLTRPYPIAKGVWSGSATRNTLLQSIYPLRDYIQFNNALIGKLTGFSLLRMQMEFILRINGTRFHYGSLVLAWYPLMSLENSSGTRHNVYSGTMQPSTIVTPFADNVDPLIVPFIWPYHYINITELQNQIDFGNLKIFVLAPLGAVGQTTVPTVPYTLYVRMVNPVLTGFTSSTPAVADPIVLQSMVGSQGQRVVNEAVNPYRCYGEDISIRMGVQDSNPPTTDEEQEFNQATNMYKEILSHRSYYNYILWSSSDLEGAPLLTTTVSPRHGRTVAGNNDIRNYLGTLATMHTFWRGTINFKLQIFSSGFHTGRFSISWDPVLDLPTSGSSAIHNTNRIIVDLQQQTSVEFSVPYAFYKPWRPTAPTVQTGFPSLQFAVVNPLTTPSGAATTICMVLWAYGSSTLKFAFPLSRVAVSIFNVAPMDQESDIVEQCYKLDSDFPSISASHDLFPSATSPDVCTSVMDTCRRLAPIYGDMDNLGNTSLDYISVSLLQPVGTYANPFCLFQTMFAAMRGSVRYAAMPTRASIDSVEPQEDYPLYSIQYGLDYSNDPNTTTLLTTNPSYGIGSSTVSTPSIVVEAPFVSTAKFWLTSRTTAHPDSFPRFAYKPNYGPGGTVLSLHHTFALSPGFDFCFGMQMAPLLAGTIGTGT